MSKNKIISIVGLTSSGKSSLGIKIAREYNGEIISADSRQIYRGLDLGTGKITPYEMTLVKHHLIDIVNPGEHFDVFQFQSLAYKTIDDILSRGKIPIIVGGTGLYSRAVVEGYNFENGKNQPKFNVLQIALMPPKEIIRPLIQKRLDERIADGMIEETRQLIEKGVSPRWLESLGLEYYWNVQLIEGKITMEEYRKNLGTKIMQFAKRQRTWFKREKNTHFLSNPDTFYLETKSLVDDFGF